jgi:hypothetical protein
VRGMTVAAPGCMELDSEGWRCSLCLDAIAKLRVARRLSALPLIAQSGSGTSGPFTAA